MVAGSVAKLPMSWWGLFVAFRNGLKPLVSAECWWRDATMSHYGERPTWECLISCLMKTTQPRINDNKLTFVPTFFALDDDFQRLILSFMIHHKSELPVSMTSQLVRDLEMNLSHESQLWIVSLLKILKEFTDSPDRKCYNFSDDNKDVLTSLFSLLQSQKENVLLPEANLEAKPFHSNMDDFKSSNHYNNDLEIVESEKYLPTACALNKEEKAFEQEPQDIGKEKETMDDNYMVDSGHLELPLEIQQQVIHLNFLLHQTDDMQSATPTEMQLFVTCSSKQLQQICNQLELESLTEAAFSTLCRHLIEIGNDISYENCFHLAKVFVQPKFFTQSRQISRILTSALMNFAKRFPKPFIDGVLVPCAVAKKLDLPQAELVNRLIKEVFSINHKNYLVQQLSKESPPLETGILALLENLLDGKLELSTELPYLIAWFRKATTTELDSSSKYGRFILMFINKHKKQFTKNDVNNLHQIIENHKTFIKKAVLNALKDLLLNDY